MNSEPVKIGKVEAGSELTVRMKLRAPEKGGEYASYFRFVNRSKNLYFGPQVWCHILVTEDIDQMKEDELAQAMRFADVVESPNFAA